MEAAGPLLILVVRSFLSKFKVFLSDIFFEICGWAGFSLPLVVSLPLFGVVRDSQTTLTFAYSMAFLVFKSVLACLLD